MALLSLMRCCLLYIKSQSFTSIGRFSSASFPWLVKTLPYRLLFPARHYFPSALMAHHRTCISASPCLRPMPLTAMPTPSCTTTAATHKQRLFPKRPYVDALAAVHDWL